MPAQADGAGVRTNAVTRWTARAVGLLGIGLLLQVSLAHAIHLLGIHYTGEGWVTNAHRRLIPELLLGEAERNRPPALAAALPALSRALRDNDASTATALLATGDPDALWWAVKTSTDDSSPAIIASTSSACDDVILSWSVPGPQQQSPEVFMCGTQPVALERVALEDGGGWLFFGTPLRQRFLDRVRALTSTEAILSVDGEPVATSMRRPDGRYVSLTELDPTPPTVDGLTFERTDVFIPDYGGFRDELADEIYCAGSARHHWYVATGRLDPNGRVQLSLYAPEGVLTQGTFFALAILVIGSVIVLLVLGLVIRRLIRRYTGPLEQLSQSARQVARGDITHEVAVPDGHEMTAFCCTYNDMLTQLGDLMRTSNRLSREAGMAEIATGVLHNVGNAINSVNTGVTLAREHLELIPSQDLERLASLVRDHREDLAAFLVREGQGAVFVDFITELSVALQHAQRSLREELDVVDSATRHTIEIISSQQRHARFVSVSERCDVREAIEDAIRICGMGRTDEDIEIVRDYAEVTAVIDRHRVIQIVVNLLTNARDALQTTARNDKGIWVTLGHRDGGVFIRVRDNGPGVSQNAKSELFSMGFTTKPQGHGFGLHASANSAVEMGGSLRLLPTPPGGGAAFELTLNPAALARAA